MKHIPYFKGAEKLQLKKDVRVAFIPMAEGTKTEQVGVRLKADLPPAGDRVKLQPYRMTPESLQGKNVKVIEVEFSYAIVSYRNKRYNS